MPLIRDILARTSSRLASRGVPDAQWDAGWLLAHVLGTSRLEALARGHEHLNDKQVAALEELVARRENREPLQYILGETVFMGHVIKCRPPVLIPRNDTEALVEQALLQLRPGQRALDLCCGSGAIAVSLKLGCPEAMVHAGDISPDAVGLTLENARLHGVEIDVRRGDLFAPFEGQRFDLICCNPPYIPARQLPGLQPEVRFEPALALDGGADGLQFYKRVLAQAPAHLNPGGWLLFELGDGQAQAVSALAKVEFDTPKVYDDLCGRPRVWAARRKEAHVVTG